MNFKDKKVLVVDCGNFVETAPRLARDFGKVYFWKPNPDAFPTMGKSMIGSGMDGVTLINDIFQKDNEYNFDEIDLFVFTDIYFGWIQEHLVSLGKRVWGCRTADDLELYRAEYNSLQRKIGMKATDIKVVKGIQKLRDYLKTVNDKYIKISYFRGEMETWKHTNYKLSETQIDELEHNLGPLKNVIEFIVESKLDAIVEAGLDMYNIDGKYPENVLLGYELKDIAYCSKHTKFSSLPEKFKDVHTKLSNTFKAYQMRGFFSSEVRVTKDDDWYLIDPCVRQGSPPSELYMEMIDNLAEVMWFGSEGKLIEPKYSCEYGLLVNIYSTWSDENWQPIFVPDTIKRFVKFKYCLKQDNAYYIVPQHNHSYQIGSVIAFDDSIEKCIAKIKKYAEQIKGCYLDIKLDNLDKCIEAVKQGEQVGIKF